eukprot:TRINITY_DN25499_c0_g1_i1.p1 TRINITY_DN25499_c0_g1~~TRINITY_DN25499_c0_g1_i1.p1  ORF type:complete len:219 (-),score=29.11 TRINITY_DN25499_c0_g1_i1:248-904(-)
MVIGFAEVFRSKPGSKPRMPAHVLGEAEFCPPPKPLSERPDPRKRRETAGISSAYLNVKEADERLKGDTVILGLKTTTRENIRMDGPPKAERPRSAPSTRSSTRRAKSVRTAPSGAKTRFHQDADRPPAGVGMEHLNTSLGADLWSDSVLAGERFQNRTLMKSTDEVKIRRAQSAKRYRDRIVCAGKECRKVNAEKQTLRTKMDDRKPQNFPGLSGLS